MVFLLNNIPVFAFSWKPKSTSIFLIRVFSQVVGNFNSEWENKIRFPTRLNKRTSRDFSPDKMREERAWNVSTF